MSMHSRVNGEEVATERDVLVSNGVERSAEGTNKRLLPENIPRPHIYLLPITYHIAYHFVILSSSRHHSGQRSWITDNGWVRLRGKYLYN